MSVRSAILAAVVLSVGCGRGAHLEPHARPRANAAAAAKPAPSPAAPAAPAAPPMKDGKTANRWTNAAIACFTGGAWVEALGSLGEERTLATTRRCRLLSIEALGADPGDDGAMSSVRAIEPKAVDGVVAAIERITPVAAEHSQLAALVRATADACREAMLARRAAEALRKNKDAAPDVAVLTAKSALVKLSSLNVGPHTRTAKLAALVVAADHVESSRGLPPSAKVLAAAPAFEVIFGVPRPANVTSESWASYVSAAAKAGGHPETSNGSATDREKHAFASVVTAFADRFEALENELAAGEPKEVAAGYAKRLREELAAAATKTATK